MLGNLGYSAIDHGPEHEQDGYGAGVGREMAGEPRPDPLGKDSSPLMCEYLAQKEQSDVRRGPCATEMSRYGLPAQPVDATPSNPLIRQCFPKRTRTWHTAWRDSPGLPSVIIRGCRRTVRPLGDRNVKYSHSVRSVRVSQEYGGSGKPGPHAAGSIKGRKNIR